MPDSEELVQAKKLYSQYLEVYASGKINRLDEIESELSYLIDMSMTDEDLNALRQYWESLPESSRPQTVGLAIDVLTGR
jgi:hypothetical protein